MAAWGRFVGVIAFLSSIGCGGAGKPVVVEAPPVVGQLEKVKEAFSQATVKNRKPPKTIEELQPFLAKEGDAASLLKSPRDGEPLVILWGVDFKVDLDKPESDKIYIHEKTGSNGKRYVVYASGLVFELDDGRFAAAAKAPATPGGK